MIADDYEQRQVRVSNSYLHNNAMATHTTALHAVCKEQTSNGITHTPEGLPSYQVYSIVGREYGFDVDQGLLIKYNSDASKHFNKTNPFDASSFETIMDLGHNKEHTVVGNSQFNSGNKNSDFTFSENPHSERIAYNHDLKQGTFLVCTQVHSEERKPDSDDSYQSMFSIGFFVTGTDDDPKVVLHTGTFIPAKLQMLLIHSRLISKPAAVEDFDVGAAKRSLASFILDHVVSVAVDPDIPGKSSFLSFNDSSELTYTDPSDGSVHAALSYKDKDIVFTKEMPGANNKMELRTCSLCDLMERRYKLPMCSNLLAWVGINGAKISKNLTDHLIYIHMPNGDLVHVCDKRERGQKVLTTRPTIAKRQMTDSNFITSSTIYVMSNDEDATSLGIQVEDMPKELPVEAYFFNTSDKDSAGVVQMWREQFQTAKKLQMADLFSLQHRTVNEGVLYGLNSVASKKKAFCSFLSALPFDYTVDDKGIPFLTESGVAQFKERFEVHPSLFLYRFESWAVKAPSGRANDRRARFYMISIIVCLQTGNLKPDYNKENCAEDAARWRALRQNVIIEWMTYVSRSFEKVGTEDEAKKTWALCMSEKVSCPYLPSAPRALGMSSTAEPATRPTAAPSTTSDTQTRSCMPGPAPLEHLSTSSTAIVASSADGKRKATGQPDDPKPTKRNPTVDDGDKNARICCTKIIEHCDWFLEATNKFLKELSRQDDSCEKSRRCIERRKRLQCMKAEANCGNHAIIVNATNSSMRVKANIDRVACTQVFIAVVDGAQARDIMHLDRVTLMKLFKLPTGDDVFAFYNQHKLNTVNCPRSGEDNAIMLMTNKDKMTI